MNRLRAIGKGAAIVLTSNTFWAGACFGGTAFAITHGYTATAIVLGIAAFINGAVAPAEHWESL